VFSHASNFMAGSFDKVAASDGATTVASGVLGSVTSLPAGYALETMVYLGHGGMPCSAMLCCDMLCYAMQCCAMLCNAMLCNAMLCHAMPC
jgi:hypothetical protein